MIPGRFFKSQTVASPSVPQGLVAFAIGDVHGRADLLAPLLQEVLTERDGEGRPPILVFLGDYVDRGPNSRLVVDVLAQLSRLPDVAAHFLRGNHDQALLDFLKDPSAGPDWCDFGGRETLASYGVAPPIDRGTPAAWENLRMALAAALPAEHLNFLRELKMAYELGDYFFAHAGARPGVSLAAQTEQDLLWIRQPFLKDRRAFAKMIVHGHTPTQEAYADHRRICVDTGAYATGVLSAVRLEGLQRELVQVHGSPGRGVRIERHAF